MNWHTKEVDDYGNVACIKCGKAQSPLFKNCIYCCNHDHLKFVEDYDCGWRVTVNCAVCGKNFGFTNEDLIDNYTINRINIPDHKQEVYGNLCIKDKRNPMYDDIYGGDLHDGEPDPVPRGDNCYCDNCFNGRDKLALMICDLMGWK